MVIRGPQLILACLLFAILSIIFWSYNVAQTLESNHSNQKIIDKKMIKLRTELAREINAAMGKFEGVQISNSSELIKILKSIDSEYEGAKSIFSEFFASKHDKNLINEKLDKKSHRHKGRSYRSREEFLGALLAEEQRQMRALHTDNIINNLEYFSVTPPKSLVNISSNAMPVAILSEVEVNVMAMAAAKRKGVYLNESHVYARAKVQTFGRFFEYHHNYNDPCMVCLDS